MWFFLQGHAKSSTHEAWEGGLIAEKCLPCSSVAPTPPLEEEWAPQSIHRRTSCPQARKVGKRAGGEEATETLAVQALDVQDQTGDSNGGRGGESPGTEEFSPHSDGSIATAVGVVNDGVEGLIHPLPEHHGGGLPEGTKTLTSLPSIGSLLLGT